MKLKEALALANNVEWIAFKRFRNTLRDYLSALDNTPPDKV